jgi:acetyl esterase/lipase
MSNTKTRPAPPPFEPELAEILPAFAGFVPVNMTAEQIEKYRAMPIPPISEQIGDQPVQCVDFTIPGYQGVDMVVSVISRKDHARPGPGIYHIHGGGMVMANRFAGASDLVAWAMKFDAVCVTVEYRRAPENPDPIPVEDCYAGLAWMAAHARELLVDPERLISSAEAPGAACPLAPPCWRAIVRGRSCSDNSSSAR